MKRLNKNDLEIILIILLFITVGLVMYSIKSYEDWMDERITDRHQTQEIINYHRSQGREIIVFE